MIKRDLINLYYVTFLGHTLVCSFLISFKFLTLIQYKRVQIIHTARSIEIVPRGGPTIFRLMLMNSRGGPPILGLYVDEF